MNPTRILLFVLSLVLGAAAHAASARKPNIIFIMADDLGYTDVACFGSKYYETPNIDRLASQGMKLTNYPHHQNCAPSRAALMTGQYSPRTGLYTVGGIDRFEWQQRPLRPVDDQPNLKLDRTLPPAALKSAGYVTGMFGKWHLGNGAEYHPSKRGFDEALVTEGKHFEFETRPKFEYPKGQYLADFLTDRAVDFIKRHKDEPFFLYLPHFGVHSPFHAKPELIAKFKDKPPVGGHKSPIMAAMIASVDESVGRVMATLDELKLAENTVLIFTTDNGGVGGYSRAGVQKANEITDNAPLRSGKGSLYEGGTRVPFIVRWPGTVPAGTANDTPGIHVDMYPTLVSIAGGKLPTTQVFDGESLAPLFRDAKGTLPREAIYQHFPGYLGAGDNTWRTTPVGTIQAGEWKLLEYFEDGRLELYNLKNDIGEEKNLATAMPEKTQELHAKMKAWRAAIDAPMPTANTPKEAEGKKKGGGGKKKKKAEKGEV